MQPEARARGYKPGGSASMSRAVGARSARATASIKIDMHFLPDVYVPCEQCNGKRYNRETLEVRYKGSSIADVFDMPVAEALAFFRRHPEDPARASRRWTPSASATSVSVSPRRTLSGGEAQRVKLATELSKIATGRRCTSSTNRRRGCISPTSRLLEVLQRLVDRQHRRWSSSTTST